jgi:hypothetical protein
MSIRISHVSPARPLAIGLVSLLSWGSLPAASQTTLDFEDVPAETVVTTQFATRGVVFPSGAFVDADAAARSGTRVLRSGDPADEFHQGPLVLQFSSGQRAVSFFAGAQFPQQTGTLRAFDGSGALVATDGPRPVPPASFTTPFQVRLPTTAIRRVEFEVTGFAFESLDDLTFEGEDPSLPDRPPTVTIEEPAGGAEVDASTVVARGTVSGPGLLSTARMTVVMGRPPDSTAPPLRTVVGLSGTGEARTFAEPLSGLLGPVSITVLAENSGGGQGSQTVDIVNLPESIRRRHAAEGGASALGPLRYGTRTTCTVAVFGTAAIAAQGTTTHLVRGGIFEKWFAERDAGVAMSRLGCPLGEERGAPGDSRAQDFQNGRVYTALSTGTHVVPGVFRDAIDILGGEAANGVPIADPTRSTGVMRTWLFQRFMRPDRPELLASTFEIRGTPPTLWVQRQAGDLDRSVFFDFPITAASPTLWRRFPCADNLGPCDVRAPSSEPSLQDAGDRFCQGTTYPLPPPPVGPKEWEPVVGDHVLTRLSAMVRRVHLASKDNPITHSCLAAGALDLFPSDLNVLVRPLHPHRHLFAENTVNIEIEFEHCWFAFAFAAGMEPRAGDLVFVAGRWIIDCGHRPYRSEIHPPAMVASMRTVTLDGRPATKADIWINGTYSGERIDLEIFPPPRPSPNAILTLQKPLDATSAVDIEVDASIVHQMIGRARFSATLRRAPVTGHGEMQLEGGRVYHGRWHVFWTER